MNTLDPVIQNLARRLIAFEGARWPSEGQAGEAARTCSRLRIPLAKFAGAAGFRSLMERALVLTAREFPWLASVRVEVDGSLDGFDAATMQQGHMSGGEAGIAVVTQLLGLLTAFVGESLTLHLVRSVWPGAHTDDTDRKG